MSTPAGWICRQCRARPRSRVLQPNSSSIIRRSFVSFDKVPDAGQVEDLSLPTTKPGKGKGKGKGTNHRRLERPSGSNVDQQSDVLLEKLFKSTGREPPNSPLHLRYSRQVLQVGRDASQPTEQLVSEIPQTSPPSKTSEQDVEGRSGNTDQGAGGWGSPVAQSQESRTIYRDPGTGSGLSLDKPVEVSTTSALLPHGSSRPRSISQIPNVRGEKNIEDSVIRTISDGLRLSRLGRVKNTWEKYLLKLHAGEFEDKEKVRATLKNLFRRFILSQKRDLAIQALNELLQQGGQAELIDWTMLLDMARTERDYGSMSLMWAKMQELGILPDNYAWVSYMTGMAKLGLANMYRVLDALSDQWQQTTTKGRDLLKEMNPQMAAAYMPSIVPFNAALELVVYQHNEDHITQLLHRAEEQGVRPDLTTFNTLLKRAVRIDDASIGLERIFSEMKERQIEPDGHTITILITATLRNTAGDPDVAQKTVEKLLADCDAMGLQLHKPVYTAGLDIFLNAGGRHGDKHNKEGPLSLSAARAILKHMVDKGLKPSPHIYTILLQHYFQAGATAAATQLYISAKDGDIKVDNIFWDHVVRGYARAADLDKMLDCLRALPALDVSLGWTPLDKALGALAEAEHYEACRQLVDDVAGRRGIAAPGIRRDSRGELSYVNRVNMLRQSGILT